MVSSQSPHPIPPSQPALLNASNLELLVTPHEKNRVQEFVASQSRYAKAQANEGRAVCASWGISTPEKNKMHLHQPSAGFETPVLRPRATQIQAGPEHRRHPSSPHSKSSTDKQTTQSPKKVKTSRAVREADSPERQKKQGKKTSTAKKSGRSNQARKERHARSDTDEEHLARLTERRERKRAKREIMNPREVKTGKGEKENKNDAHGSNDKKKQKIPAGLALMHGFASVSVGKSRLTIEPPPNFGVFNKGKASTKIKVDESKRTKSGGFPSRIFSEDQFLNSKPAKPLVQRLVSETSSNSSISRGPSSPVETKKPAAVTLRETPIKIRETTGRRQPAASMRCDDEMGNCNASGVVDGQGSKPTNRAKPEKSRSPPRSESWVIEQDGFSLPSTTSDVAIASVKSKARTALLNIRAASWSRVLQNDSLDEKVLVPPEHHKNTRAISTLSAAAIVQGGASHTHLELEEQATIGPWESASQLEVARSTLHTREQRPAYSKYFSLPYESQPKMHLPNNSLGKPGGVDSGRPNSGGDATIDEQLFYKEAGAVHQGEDLFPTSPPANTSPVKKAPAEGVSVLQTSSLDSVDRALLLDIPVVTRSRSRIRRTMRWHKFNSTPENMLFHQYGLDPEDHCQVMRPSLNDLGNSLGDLGNMQDNALSFCGGGYAEGLEGHSEGQTGHSEHYPAIISDSPEFASQVGPNPLNGSYDCRDGATFLIGEDMGYEGALETEEGCTDFDSDPISVADWRALPEGDTDRTASIHLWDDKAWPRGDAVGGGALQEGCSHLTTVQKVEQDVARKLKGHWFPHKF